MRIENVTKDDAGKYFCTSSSTLGETKSTNLDLIVQFKPSILSLTKETMQTGRGLMAELTCLIIGEPQPRVSWYKGNEALALDDRIKIENAGNRHILLVNRLRSDDANSYMCYTINELGQAQDVIEINQEDITEPQTEHKNTELSKGTTEIEINGPNISQDVLNSFRAKIESDINILRNLTYKALTQSASSSGGSISDSFFADLQRIQLQLREFKQLSQ